MRTISGVVLILALSTCTAYYDSYNASETCNQVSSSLNDFLWSIEAPPMRRVGPVTELLTGVNIIRPESLDPVMCPLIDSTSLSEMHTQLVETGLVGKVAALAYRAGIMGYAAYLEAAQSMPEHLSEEWREFYRDVDQLTTHLQEYGYMDFDTISLAVTYGCSVGIGINTPLVSPPIFPGSLTGDDAQVGEMLWVDIRTILRGIKKMSGPAWPMVKQTVFQYTAGVVDLSNGDSMRNLINGIAACRSEADVATFVQSHFLGPLLNLYFPQLEGALASARRHIESYMEYVLNYEYMSEQEKEKYRRMGQAFYAMHDALLTSGFLSLI